MASELADLERGERIRELREARRLTQQAVWERMCVEGGSKPDGRPFISLRMYQRYEEGRGISWEKLRVLAHVLDAGEDFILRGEGDRRQPRPARQLDTDLAERLAHIEERMAAPAVVDRLDGELADRITAIEETLAGITTLLRQARSEQDRIGGLAQQAVDLVREARMVQDGFTDTLAEQTAVLERIEGATRHAHDAADRLDDAVAQAATALRSAPPKPRRAASKTAPKRTPRASS